MQLLQAQTNAAESAQNCALAMLDGLPPVIWFIRQRMRRHRAAGISVPQFRTLVQLDACPTASLSAVAENLGVSLPTASRMISGLVNKGLVARQTRTDDRRLVSLVLTDRGRQVLGSSRQETQAQLAAAIAHLGEAECRSITSAMRVLHDAFAPRGAATGEPDGSCAARRREQAVGKQSVAG